MAELLKRAEKLLLQEKNDSHKLYSVHAPEMECIAMGKVHKHYEFGNKVGLVTTSRENWIVGVQAVMVQRKTDKRAIKYKLVQGQLFRPHPSSC